MSNPYESDDKDFARVMRDYGPPTIRCRGDRIIAKSYCCSHCGSSNPQELCLSRKARKEAQLHPASKRLLVLAMKHCPQDHHDWQEILEHAKEMAK